MNATKSQRTADLSDVMDAAEAVVARRQQLPFGIEPSFELDHLEEVVNQVREAAGQPRL